MTATPELPTPGSTVRRTTARVLPVLADGRVLLLHGWDPERPDSPYWFTIGGAVEPGESLAQAAARELYEEAGIVVEPADIGTAMLVSAIEFDWGGVHIVQDQTFFAVGVDSDDVSFAGHDHWERATIDTSRWWSVDDLVADGGAAHCDIIDAMREAVLRYGSGQ